MFELDTEFYKLPLQFDAGRLADEVLQFAEHEWRKHPQGHAGNTAIPLVSVGGGVNDDVKGPMMPTEFLRRCPYLEQVLSSLGTVIGRARLMRIAGQGDATLHVDTNYYWMHHVRVHIPAVTYPPVKFVCNDKSVHMAAGETWIFDSWKLHNVYNPVDSPRIHLVADTVGSAHFWDLVNQAERPCAADASQRVPVRQIAYRPNTPATFELEEENFPVVMSPWEQRSLADRMLRSFPSENWRDPAFVKLKGRLEKLHQQWHALWTRFGAPADGIESFRPLISEFDAALPGLAEDLVLTNGVKMVEALRQTIVRPAFSPEVVEKRKLKTGAMTSSQL